MKNKEKNQELAFQLINKEYLQPIFKDDIDLSAATKFPISDIAMLGTAFTPMVSLMSSLSTESAELISKLGTDTLYAATNKTGEAIKLTGKVNGESGRYIGSYIKNNKTAQARFNEVAVKDLTSNIVSFDPMTSVMAAELMYIAKEVKAIKEQQKVMFKYIQIDKRSKIEGSLSFLIKVLNDYKYNFENDVYKASTHIKVLDIKQEAEQTINSCRKLTTEFLDNSKDDYNSLGFEIQNYQMSLFTYALSSFVEIVVLENFDEKYLSKIIDRLETMSYEYKKIYTNCYDYLQGKIEKSLSSTILKAASKASGFLGEIASKTKLNDKTKLNKVLKNVETKLNELKEYNASKVLETFINYKNDNVIRFNDMIKYVSMIYNSESTLIFDNKYLYLPNSNSQLF